MEELAQIFAPAGVLSVFLVWLGARIKSGRVVLSSSAGAALLARAEKAEAERDQALACRDHQRAIADAANAKLIDYLERDSQRIRLCEVEALANKDDKP